MDRKTRKRMLKRLGKNELINVILSYEYPNENPSQPRLPSGREPTHDEMIVFTQAKEAAYRAVIRRDMEFTFPFQDHFEKLKSVIKDIQIAALLCLAKGVKIDFQQLLPYAGEITKHLTILAVLGEKENMPIDLLRAIVDYSQQHVTAIRASGNGSDGASMILNLIEESEPTMDKFRRLLEAVDKGGRSLGSTDKHTDWLREQIAYWLELHHDNWEQVTQNIRANLRDYEGNEAHILKAKELIIDSNQDYDETRRYLQITYSRRKQ
jgi:hypothetical protein